jgi:hypothetical protein
VRPPAGAEVLLSVRPEKAMLLAPGAPVPAPHNRIEGRVVEHFFHGNALRVGVDIGQGEPFLVDVQLQLALGEAGVPEPGSAVALAIHPASISVFRA